MSFWKINKLGNDIYELVLNRPEKLNAFTWNAFLELPGKVRELEEKKAKIVWVRGEGGNFSSGLDFKDFLQNNASALEDASEMEEKILQMQEAFLSLRNANFITLALVSGYCIGAGVDLISLCDLRFASAEAKFCLKELDFGIIPDLGSLHFLPESIGVANTKFLCFTTESLSAKEGEKMGLFYKVYENKHILKEEVLKISREIVAKPTLPLLQTKKMINHKSSLQDMAKWNAEFLVKTGLLGKLLT